MGNNLTACVTDDASAADELAQTVSELSADVVEAISACVMLEPDVIEEDDRGDFMSISQDDAKRHREIEIENTLDRMGIPVRDFYQVPLLLDKPVGSRVLPDLNARRTGITYSPGEVVEVVQEVTVDGTRYLRTDDKTGWLFPFHPKLGITMLEKIPGHCEIQSSLYKCMSNSEPVAVRNGPSVLSAATGDFIYPSEEIHTTESWSPDDGSGLVFLKLRDGQGWISKFDMKSNVTLFGVIT
jgi:hypothetical protein